MITRDAAGRPRLSQRGRAVVHATEVAAEDWLASHGPALVVILALAAVALLTGAADTPGAEWISTGGIGAVVGAVLTFLGTYRARQAQASRIEGRARQAAESAHAGAYGALDAALGTMRAEVDALRRDLEHARSQASTARAEAERMRAELTQAEAEIAALRARSREIVSAVRSIDQRISTGSTTPPGGHRVDLETSDPADGR